MSLGDIEHNKPIEALSKKVLETLYKLDLYTDLSGNSISISKPPYIANGRNPGKSVRSRTRNYISIAYALRASAIDTDVTVTVRTPRPLNPKSYRANQDTLPREARLKLLQGNTGHYAARSAAEISTGQDRT